MGTQQHKWQESNRCSRYLCFTLDSKGAPNDPISTFWTLFQILCRQHSPSIYQQEYCPGLSGDLWQVLAMDQTMFAHGSTRRKYWSNKPISRFKGAPCCLGDLMTRIQFELILYSIRYTNTSKEGCLWLSTHKGASVLAKICQWRRYQGLFQRICHRPQILLPGESTWRPFKTRHLWLHTTRLHYDVNAYVWNHWTGGTGTILDMEIRKCKMQDYLPIPWICAQSLQILPCSWWLLQSETSSDQHWNDLV